MSRSTWTIAAADGGMYRSDLRVHFVRDGAVARVALAARAELDQLHRLAGVEVEDVADPVAEAQRVWGDRGEAATGETVVLVARDLEGTAVLLSTARELDLFGHAGAQRRAERLPLDGQHPVSLEIPERSVVGDDLEPVAQ